MISPLSLAERLERAAGDLANLQLPKISIADLQDAAQALRQFAWRPIDDAAKEPWGVWLTDGFMVRVGVWHSGRWADLVKLEIGGVPSDLHFTPIAYMTCPRPAAPQVEDKKEK